MLTTEEPPANRLRRPDGAVTFTGTAIVEALAAMVVCSLRSDVCDSIAGDEALGWPLFDQAA